MNEQKIRSLLPTGLTLGEQMQCFDSIGSTNDALKELAMQGGRHGTVVLADSQSGGRGRMGRRFESPAGAGVYLSVLLRPNLPPSEVLDLTAWTAVAVCNALENCCGTKIDIKWTNDLLLNGRKLGGILTELVMDGADPCVIVGIGLNVTQRRTEFAAMELEEIATSLFAEGIPAGREEIAAAILVELDRMAKEFPQERQKWLEHYRMACVTVNRPVIVLRGGERHAAYALAVEDDFSLRVCWENGDEECLCAGEVSVRGMMGYQ